MAPRIGTGGIKGIMLTDTYTRTLCFPSPGIEDPSYIMQQRQTHYECVWVLSSNNGRRSDIVDACCKGDA